jgi:hypothetical protein
MKCNPFVRFLMTLLVLLMGVSCGGGSKSDVTTDTGPNGDQATQDTIVQEDGITDGTEGEDTGQIKVEKFTISFQKRDRMDPYALKPFFTISSQAKAISEAVRITPEDFDCSTGCVLTPKADYFIYVKSASAGNLTLMIAPMSGGQVNMAGAQEITSEARYFRVLDDQVIFSVITNPGDDENPTTIEFNSVSYSAVGNQNTIASFTTPDNKVAHSYSGDFVASPDGSHLVLVYVRNVSATVYYAPKNGSFQKIDPILGGEVTTSEYIYHPDAISPDGKYFIMLTQAEKKFSIHKYPLPGNSDDQRSQELGPYGTMACDAIEDGKYTEAVGDPIISSDGKYIYFIAKVDCKNFTEEPVTCNSQYKPLTNIIRMDKSLDLSSMKNLTENPRNSGPENIIISELALNSTGKFIVFSGSPDYGGCSREMNDRELWLLKADQQGSQFMLTDELKYLPEVIGAHP